MDADRQPSPKFAAFVAALEALCREHGVHLCASGYEGLEVWEISITGEPLTEAGIKDCTNGS